MKVDMHNLTFLIYPSLLKETESEIVICLGLDIHVVLVCWA